ncbi:MAG: two-component hybrid sensor and regulator [Rhodospirillaceae bacterium]|nr:MAG: two-component hybrid sensor and regulator [Rhodospirillaceae bacterium]
MPCCGRAMGLLLSEWGLVVIKAASGDEAGIALARAERWPDVILADYRLRRGETGLDVMATLATKAGAARRTFILTRDTAPEILQAIRSAGHELLQKSVMPSVLFGKLEEALAWEVDSSKPSRGMDAAPEEECQHVP